MKSEWYEKLKFYGMMHPDKLEALTEKEFLAMTERREEYGNFSNGSMYYQCSDHVCI